MRHRKIAPQGIIVLQNQWVFISSALAGWSVGLEGRADGKSNVWFGRLLLGELDEAAFTFNATAPRSTSEGTKE